MSQGAFQTKEQVLEYLGHEKLYCFECGRVFKSLGLHLTLAHEMTPREYRIKYGIPQKYGLCGALTKKRFSDKFKERFNDEERAVLASTNRKKAGPRKVQTAPKVPYHRKMLKKNLEIGRETQGILTEDDIVEFISRIESGRTIEDVASDEDMPTSAGMYKAIKERFPHLKERQRQAAAISFSLAIKRLRGSEAVKWERFAEERLLVLREASDHGMSKDEACALLSIQRVALNTFLAKHEVKHLFAAESKVGHKNRQKRNSS